MIGMSAGERAALLRLAARSRLFLPALVPWIMPAEGKTRRGFYVAPSPRYGEAGICRVNMSTGEWADHLPATRGGPARASGDDVISLIAYRDGTEYIEAAATLIVILTDGTAIGSFE